MYILINKVKQKVKQKAMETFIYLGRIYELIKQTKKFVYVVDLETGEYSKYKKVDFFSNF